ncbi:MULTISPECIES: BlaI/MecI/CopY family transcriptional regulator [Chryseobacterium]|uniref:BlaI/MecI/CopY family transcriptional regulator n=1 Tax=Chryseobacterium sp. R2A-55 TaxID=2744445 RepID=UPI001F38107E|nr:BlaI/MecI/CopY family transcriptional regulator [Chryseobacterium sp. R2A-55]
MKINHLTPSEEQLMNIFWKLNSGYLREIIEHYPEPKPHQNTISTFLKILVEKEFLTTEKEGRIFRYTVAVPFDDYKKFQLRNFLDHYFAGSANELLKMMLDEKHLKPSDFNQHFEIKATVVPVKEAPEVVTSDAISEFVEELKAEKKKKKTKKKKKK